MPTEIHARCSCGAVTFQCSQAPVVQLVCHCKDCRQFSGNDYLVLAFFEAEHTKTSGKVSVQDFVAASGAKAWRESCAACGTLVFDKSEAFSNLVGVTIDCIEAPFTPAPTAHVWTKRRLPHVTVYPGIPEFEGNFG